MCLLGANIVKMFYIQNDFGKKCFVHKTNLIKKRFVEKTLRKRKSKYLAPRHIWFLMETEKYNVSYYLPNRRPY